MLSLEETIWICGMQKVVFNLEKMNKGQIFLSDTKQMAQKAQYTPVEIVKLMGKVNNEEVKESEIYLFANYDICNFTKYKRDNKDWTLLLKKFIGVGVNEPSAEWSMQFWKFNGDSITYRKKIQSIDEICKSIKGALSHLESLQQLLNQDSKTTKRVYIRGALWISGFCKGSSISHNATNNIKFDKSQFGQEYVGENIDEGFRLCACAKSGNLAIDPKIVYILNLYSILLNGTELNVPIGWREEVFKSFLSEKIATINSVEAIAAKNAVKSVLDKMYLMEFKQCKGVWDDREYPVFWYINDLDRNEFVYDDVVGGKCLYEHDIHKCKEKSSEKEEQLCRFAEYRDELMSICYQVGIINTIEEIVMNLVFFPAESSSGEYVYDAAKLYYMIACLLTNGDEKLGVLIFKRSMSRYHLKGVWDLISIKHAKVKTNSNYCFVESYLKEMLIKSLGTMSDVDVRNMREKISFSMDKKRASLKPLSLCNIYRNGEVHNGVLSVACIDIQGCDVETFVENLKNNLRNANPRECQYTDVKLIKSDDVFLNENGIDYIKVENIKIRPLEIEEISNDSNEVYLDSSHVSRFDVIDNETDYGIAYLAYSIKQVLEEGV